MKISQSLERSNEVVDVLIWFNEEKTLIDTVNGSSPGSSLDTWKQAYVIFRNVSDFKRHKLQFGAYAVASSTNLIDIQFGDVSVTGIPLTKPPYLADGNSIKHRCPLHECEGVCITDAYCAGSLKCFLESKENPVPGCAGQGKDGYSYCFSDKLLLLGNKGCPLQSFPLGDCKRDCDRDKDCIDGLQCFWRQRWESVLGCDGFWEKGKDYCYRELLVQVGDNGKPGSAYPLDECQGDCDNNDECARDLCCFERSGDENAPGCLGIGKTKKD